jgi:hypothetical protein
MASVIRSHYSIGRAECVNPSFLLLSTSLFLPSIVLPTPCTNQLHVLSNVRYKRGKKRAPRPDHLNTMHTLPSEFNTKEYPKGVQSTLVLCSTTRDHACASRRSSRARYCTSTLAPRTPRRLPFRSFTLPLINQPSHALIRLLRCRGLHLIARRRGNRGVRAHRGRSHRSVKSAPAAHTTSSFELYWRAPPTIRCQRFRLRREARKTDRRSVFRTRLLRSPDATTRWLLRRIRCEPRQTHSTKLAAPRGRRNVRGCRPREGRPS